MTQETPSKADCENCRMFNNLCTLHPQGHTPGPWKTDINYESQRVLSKDGFCVADCTFLGKRKQEALANARLIAKAPELLEACKSALETCKHLNKVNPADLDRFNIDTSILEAAISSLS